MILFQVITFAHTLMANSDLTGVERTLIVCPLNTVLNWLREWTMWLDKKDQFDVLFSLYKFCPTCTYTLIHCDVIVWGFIKTYENKRLLKTSNFNETTRCSINIIF
jgi:hypothetical protein